jgi:hypothetical protein
MMISRNVGVRPPTRTNKIETRVAGVGLQGIEGRVASIAPGLLEVFVHSHSSRFLDPSWGRDYNELPVANVSVIGFAAVYDAFMRAAVED